MSLKKDFFKVKVAIFFGYNGRPFFGSQKIEDPTKPTTEGELEKALHKANMITEYNYNDLHKICWRRASRTDKGVHAAVNAISCKICLVDKYVKDAVGESSKADFKKSVDWQKIIGDINANLHASVRVFGLRFVTKGFDIRRSACSRKYEYVAPLSMFRGKMNVDKTSDEILADLNKLAQVFKGSHNYHNFTKGTKPKDKQNWRVILDIKVEKFVPQFSDLPVPKDTEFVIFYLHGQSFLYHQIRKMVGVISQCSQLGFDENYINKAFELEKTDVWLAPSEGLLLDRVSLSDFV